MALTKASYAMINGAAVNVLDFGADPSGVADSTDAFVNAMAALPTYGGTVWVPNGDYKITKFAIKAGTAIIGESKVATNIFPYNASGEYAIALNDISNRLENLTVDGSNSNGYGLRIEGVKTKSVQHLIIRDFTNTTASLDGVGVLLTGTYAASLRDCEITANNVNVLMRGGEVNEILFDNCTIEFSAAEGVIIDNGIGVKFLNCSFGHHGGDPWVGTAISVTDTDATISIDTCWFEWCYNALTFAGTQAVVTNNHSAGGFVFTAGFATVTNNQLFGYGSEISLPSGTAVVSVLGNKTNTGGSPYVDTTGGLKYIDGVVVTYANGAFAPETSGTITINSSINTLRETANETSVVVNGRVGVSSVSSPVGNYVDLSGLTYPCAALTEDADWCSGSCMYYDESTGSRTIVPAVIYGGLQLVRIYVNAATLAADDYFVLSITYPTQ